jgi:thiol:disulfide interchange protein
VYEVTQGARELQQLLEDAPYGTPAVIDWHAKWAVACRSHNSGLKELAARYPGMMILRVDVEASGSNAALAREKVR